MATQLQQLNNNILSTIATDKVDTLEQLYELQTRYAPSNVFLPFAHNIYDIDLNTREIHGPNYISVRRDHKAEVIYFKVDRYFDYMDLSTTICIIEYIIPGDTEKIPYIYVVPFFDTFKFVKENKIIFPWTVGDIATSQDGTIEYAIRFYKIDKEGKKLIYNLNTLPAKSKILSGLESDEEILKVEYDNPIASNYENLINQIITNKTYWTIM